MIQVRGLNKAFQSVQAVDGVSFDVAGGETFALLGPNGSGKTTTLKAVAGLQAPTSGEILIGGVNVRKNPKEARRMISYLPQRVAFPESLTAREILEFYCELRKLPVSRVEEELDRFRLRGTEGRCVQEFSGGMVQRLGIAVSCLADAPILLLDEPTVSLDPDTAIEFRQYLSEQKRVGKTILFSSHVLTDVEQLADKVAILVGGRLMAVESVETLRNGLASGSGIRVATGKPDERLADAARKAGAATAVWEGSTLVLQCEPAQRWQVLRALEQAGASIEGFSTAEPALEEIYLRYVHESHGGGAGATCRGMSGEALRAGGC